ncbi:D-alanyl-D-alanine carboxypeptidase/D-alanyl-D-alanine-endopeptidase [Gaiella sp.]|uniref:D-alanyl-D-alanine carboxypeptidase/D-alanyl-D-alanine-endopeptidase n=1 Tax=Gaiella sp. TaxID=2663207 RepID=UPI002E36C358|nr:D-alanyl-D-alanine carboxypeptidase [Gaiella sp.]HEX5583565.1 D-alanyl-D-alanine carboxypeptidase [Gaiella sp.]
MIAEMLRTRLTLLLALCVLLLPTGSTAAPASGGDLAARLTKTLRSPYLSLGRTAAIAMDASTGVVLYAHNATRPIVPASNEKLPVAWTALTLLGPSYRFRTEVLGAGVRTGTTWRGDLYLEGAGDPTLTAADLGRLARSIRVAGITRITGRIRGDESAYDGRRAAPGWKRYFVGIESPPLSALIVDRAKGWPALSPPLLAARTLREALLARGVKVAGRPGLGIAPGTAVPIAAHHSAQLATIVQEMNRTSDNFVAEMLLKELGTLEGGIGTTAGGARVVLDEMRAAGIPVAGVRLADGSGLSSLDRVTASALAGVIRAGMHDARISKAFVASFAVAGRNGTLRTRLPALAGIVRGKTGTTDLACSLSGVIGENVVFSVLQNGDPVSFWSARAAQDRFVTALSSSLTGLRKSQN